MLSLHASFVQAALFFFFLFFFVCVWRLFTSRFFFFFCVCVSALAGVSEGLFFLCCIYAFALFSLTYTQTDIPYGAVCGASFFFFMFCRSNLNMSLTSRSKQKKKKWKRFSCSKICTLNVSVDGVNDARLLRRPALSFFFFFSLPNVKLRDGSTYTHTSFARTDLIPLHERDPPLHYSSVSCFFFFRLSLFYGLISRSHLRSAKVCSVSLAFFFLLVYTHRS